MKTIITTILILLSVLSAPALKAQCTCGNNTYSSYSNSNTRVTNTPLYYIRTSNGQLIAVYSDNNTYLQGNNVSPRSASVQNYPIQNGYNNSGYQASYVAQPYTDSNQSFEVDMNEQSPNNNYQAYNENTQSQSNYNTVPQRRTFIQKVNRGVQVVNALGQIANAVQTIVNPNVSFY